MCYDRIMATVFIALGSNVGDSQKNIQQATDLLGEYISNIQSGNFYSSKALLVPGHPDLPDFVNTAIRGETELSAQELLQFTQKIEKEVGKVYRFHWGPREIDIDIIFYGDQIINKPNLKVPHPHFHERDFVLQPLADIDPDKIDPKSGQPISKLLQSLPKSELSILQ